MTDYKEYSNELLLETLENNIRLTNYYKSENNKIREILKGRLTLKAD